MTEISFKGKEFVYNHHLSVPFRPLEMHAEKGIGNARLDGNLIIQGDNLHALKALLPHYAGKVDCIFIDPPYNTGNEGWSYNDNVNAPMIKAWMEDNPIGIEDGLRHDKWCAMMWPRLRLLHELLAFNGAIWMTLDENEIHRAREIFDEVFGEDNFIANVAWQKRTSPDSRKSLGAAFDNILVYTKNKEALSLNKVGLSESRISDYSNQDNDSRGPWASVDLSAQDGHATADQFYTITAPNGMQHTTKPGRCWGLTEATYNKLQADNRIWFGSKGTAVPRQKKFLSEVEDTTEWTWWRHEERGHTQGAKKELMSIMGSATLETPKPTRLLKRILELSVEKNSLILDSFAGSGTTAHAVLEANKKDGGNRRFILCEMEDYADELTAERVRRIINGYDFTGTQKTELLREKLTWTKLDKKPNLFRESVQAMENLHGHEYDGIKPTVKDDALIVTGETKVKTRVKGLGGEFTYCTLGPAIALDDILTGDALPDYAALGSVLFHMATNRPLESEAVDEASHYLGETDDQKAWLIYRPDLDWLQSPDAALTLSFARKLAADHPDRKHLVFAPARYVSQKMLKAENIDVDFAPLPYALYRVERE